MTNAATLLLKTAVFGIILPCVQFLTVRSPVELSSVWYAREDVHELYPQLKQGDILEYSSKPSSESTLWSDMFDKTTDSHWVVYIGKEVGNDGLLHHQVIHFSESSDVGRDGCLREDNLEELLQSGMFVRFNNGLDRYWIASNEITVVNRASRMKAFHESTGCTPFTDQSRFFAQYCRYGNLKQKDDSLVEQLTVDYVFRIYDECKGYVSFIKQIGNLFCSNWYTAEDIASLYPFLRPGDRLEYRRPLYSHYAVYIGTTGEAGSVHRHRIIHRTTRAQQSLVSLGSPCVDGNAEDSSCLLTITEDELEKPLHQGSAVRINNAADVGWEPLDEAEVVTRALRALTDPEEQGYGILHHNCEHFVNHCRYGKRVSLQTNVGGYTATDFHCPFEILLEYAYTYLDYIYGKPFNFPGGLLSNILHP